MIRQALVYGAYVYNRTGLQTPYLSEEYFQIVGDTVEKAKKAGFLLNFVDEYEWPGSEARDVWLKGLPSRVIAANPESRMRGLWYSSMDVDGPGPAQITGIQNFQSAVAARLTGHNAVDGASLTEISNAVSGGKLSWQAPAGLDARPIRQIPRGEGITMSGNSSRCCCWMEARSQPKFAATISMSSASYTIKAIFTR